MQKAKKGIGLKRLWPWLAPALVIGLIGGLLYSDYKQSVQKEIEQVLDIQIYEPDYPRLRDFKSETPLPPLQTVMSLQESKNYFTSTVIKALDTGAEDPRELPLVKSRLKWLLSQMESSGIKIDIMPNSPEAHNTAVALSSFENGQRYITFIGSQVRYAELERTPAAFHDYMLFVMMHETFHPTDFLRQPHHTRAERVEDESRAWVATMPIIKAWYDAGRHPSSRCWKIYKYFHNVCHDNPQDPLWKELVEHLTGKEG